MNLYIPPSNAIRVWVSRNEYNYHDERSEMNSPLSSKARSPTGGTPGIRLPNPDYN